MKFEELFLRRSHFSPQRRHFHCFLMHAYHRLKNFFYRMCCYQHTLFFRVVVYKAFIVRHRLFDTRFGKKKERKN